MKPVLVAAVSGGIDSVVLLDVLAKQHKYELIVTHFDHGIRKDSAADARFVEGLAKKYDLTFEMKREELGATASEEKARTYRHAFLRRVARKYKAVVATAHHSDDIIETVAINIGRGTGWRGLAVLGDEVIARPLLAMSKQGIRRYALEHELEWVEDETNASDAYLRNRLRFRINTELVAESKKLLLEYWNDQRKLRAEIETEATRLLFGDEAFSRHFFGQIDDVVASELLWTVLKQKQTSLTGPQRLRLLHAVKTAKPGSCFEAGAGVTVRFLPTTFIVETP